MSEFSLTDITPNHADQGTSIPVRITGGPFNSGYTYTAKIDGNSCTNTLRVDAGTLTATVGTDITRALADNKQVKVFENETGDQSTNGLNFAVTLPGARQKPTLAASKIDDDAGFGIVSSINYRNTDAQKLFNLGTTDPGWTKVSNKQPVGYRGSDLYDAIMEMNASSKVRVIITFGGNVSALAAAKYSAKPFLSVIGNWTPEFMTSANIGNLRGGINLDATARNGERFSHLTKEEGILAGTICLLSNPDSNMSQAERALWKQVYKGGTIFNANDLDTIRKRFIDFQDDGTLTTMIVSADPFFQDNKNELIKAANRSGKNVCYPLQTYANLHGTARPAPDRHWLHGPKLGSAFFQLGRDAVEVLIREKNGNHQGFDLRIPPMLLDNGDDES